MNIQTKYEIDSKTQGELNEWFKYHSPYGDQSDRYEALRSAARELAVMICEIVPPCADRTASLRKLRECIMTANAAIACQELE